MIWKVIIITLLIVWVIDISGIIEEMEKALSKWLGVKKARIPKPFSCSLCMTWWTLLLFFLLTGNFTIYTVGLSGLFAFLTPFFYDTLVFVRTVCEKVIGLLYYLMGEK